jgi:hypothetical protein
VHRHGLRPPPGLQPLQQPQGSVTTAGAENGFDGWIRESAIQFREPALIVARQVPVPSENSRVVLNAVTIRNDGEPRVERLAVEGPRWRDNRDRVAGVKCARLMKNRLRSQARTDQSDRAFRSRISDARPRSNWSRRWAASRSAMMFFTGAS